MMRPVPRAVLLGSRQARPASGPGAGPAFGAVATPVELVELVETWSPRPGRKEA